MGVPAGQQVGGSSVQPFARPLTKYSKEKENGMNTIILVAAAVVLGFAVGRIKSLARFNRRRAWKESEYS